ncbi:MAG: hypothetical protein JO290_09225 [Sphingomonadaceae bacterium]|nr:hypothetical protein [Sphingomonadaceae bacterium]
MADTVDTQFLAEMLQAIRADIADIKRDVHRLEVRQTVLEGHLGSLIVSIQIIREEVDDLRSDVKLIKRRLELADTH